MDPSENISLGYLISYIIYHVIYIANQESCCEHFYKSTLSLLQVNTNSYQYIKYLYSRSNFASCRGCGLLCENCMSKGTLRCEKCICIGCKQSQNVTLMMPVFNKHCWKCARFIWGKEFDYYRYPIMPSKFELIETKKRLSYNWSSIIEAMISIINWEIKAFLLTCKEFSKHIILLKKKEYICDAGKMKIQRTSCENCYRLGFLKCEKCTCSHCGYSANVSGCWPIFGDNNLQLCYDCAYRCNKLIQRTHYDSYIFFEYKNPKWIRIDDSPPDKLFLEANKQKKTHKHSQKDQKKIQERNKKYILKVNKQKCFQGKKDNFNY